MREHFIDMTGYQYGDFTLIRYIATEKRWICRCKCGARVRLQTRNILSGRSRKHCEHVPGQITEREHEIAGLVAQGLHNKEIARQLSISPKTVQAHLSNIFDKFDLSNRAELAVMVVRMEKNG